MSPLLQRRYNLYNLLRVQSTQYNVVLPFALESMLNEKFMYVNCHWSCVICTKQTTALTAVLWVVNTILSSQKQYASTETERYLFAAHWLHWHDRVLMLSSSVRDFGSSHWDGMPVQRRNRRSQSRLVWAGRTESRKREHLLCATKAGRGFVLYWRKAGAHSGNQHVSWLCQ